MGPGRSREASGGLGDARGSESARPLEITDCELESRIDVRSDGDENQT